jgi:hypothetical protein
MKFDPIRQSIWRSNIHFVLGTLLLSSVGLWAGLAIIQTAWHVNPISQAFASSVEHEVFINP